MIMDSQRSSYELCFVLRFETLAMSLYSGHPFGNENGYLSLKGQTEKLPVAYTGFLSNQLYCRLMEIK